MITAGWKEYFGKVYFVNPARVRRAYSRFAFRALVCLFAVGSLAGCDSGDLLDLAFDPPGRKTIDVTKVGVNNFFVNPEFGSIPSQYSDIRSTLGIKFVRVLFAWTTDVQPSPDASPNYGFYDAILSAVPPGVDVLVVLTHTPSWMANSANWVDGDPRKTFVERWLKPTVQRYSGVGSIIGWEVWNEPDLTTVPSDIVLGLEEPENYVDLLVPAANAIRRIDPGALVVMAATTSIQQKFPNTLRYNQTLRDLGVEGLVDVWNVHYYGSSYESVVTSNGVADFLNGISKTIWVTESGETGPNDQLAYVETAWPFLLDKIPGIQRFYYYQYGDTVPLEQNFGLRTTDPTFPVSDLYIHLREQNGG